MLLGDFVGDRYRQVRPRADASGSLEDRSGKAPADQRIRRCGMEQPKDEARARLLHRHPIGPGGDQDSLANRMKRVVDEDAALRLRSRVLHISEAPGVEVLLEWLRGAFHRYAMKRYLVR